MPEHRGVGFGGKQAKQPVSDLASLIMCLCTYAERQKKAMALSGSSVHREASL